ncbi:MAG: MutS-related protein [Candidatus Chromulinivorax sp.]
MKQRCMQLFSILMLFGVMDLYAGYHASSRNRVFQVMYQGAGGIQQSMSRILFAETKNIGFDLNLSEIAARFGCKTQVGQDFIVKSLEKVISPKDQSLTIQNRQKLIQFFIEHPDICEKFEQLIIQAVEHEQAVINFMQKRFVLDPNGNPIEFVQQWLRQWTLFQSYEQTGNLKNIAFDAPLDLVEKCKKATAYMKFDQQDLAKWTVLLLAGYAGSYIPYISNDTKACVAAGGLTLAGGYGAYAFNEICMKMIGLAGTGYSMYKYHTAALSIRDSLYSLNQLIDIAYDIEKVSRDYGVDLQFKISSIESKENKDFLAELQHPRYKEKDTNYFLLTPAVHAFIYKIYDHDDILAPVYALIGELDAYIAIAKKMQSTQNLEHTFCFAQFVDEQNPKIEMENFWNILIYKGDVVTNSIVEDRHIILTGANEGGKTTAIRAILQNIVLAQTFGIAAGTKFVFTPYDVLHSYLNVKDDILQGKSRFALELKQAQDILERIKSLRANEKFFFAFDELFTGTNGEDGALCAYNFIDNVASFKQIQFIYATHFNVLKTIGSNNPACANYKIEPPLRDEQGQFIRDKNGQMIYPYKLSMGANEVNVAMQRALDAKIFKNNVVSF